ncbi:MAG: hypothetical protein AAF725_06755 [Acidobacteriota bacterium]
MKQRPSPLRSAATLLAWTLSLAGLFAAPAAAEPAGDALTEGVVEFAIRYEDVGPMAAMLPKSEKVSFRPGAVRVESGQNVSLDGVLPGKRVQLLTAGGALKLAFVMPAPEPAGRSELVRFESADERRSIAGVEARRVDGVDREDDSNRLAYWVSDRLDARWFPVPGLEGFPLDYLQPIQDGFAHRVAERVEAKALDASLFAIPEGYEQIEIASPREISRVLKERLGGQVQVVE